MKTETILRLYRKFTHALPEEFRRRHGPEMTEAAEDLVRYTAKRRTPGALVAVVLRLFADLFWRIPIEHAAEFRQNAHYGARMLTKSPGFTLASVISLGIGIGLTVSTFSQLELMMRPVPQVEDAAALVSINERVSYPDYEYLRDGSGLFKSVAAYMPLVPLVVSKDGEARRFWGHIVSSNYFPVLGTKPLLGRAFLEEDFRADASPVVFMSHRMWENRFGRDPAVVGKAISINGHRAAIAGIGPEDFLGAAPLREAADLWIPTSTAAFMAPEAGRERLHDRKAAAFSIIGRLSDGIRTDEAEAKLDTILRKHDDAPQDPAEIIGRGLFIMPADRLFPVSDDELPILIGLPAGIVGLSLWIACSNVGTLLLARGGPRQKEIAIRLAMGASRSRIIRQLVTESLMLASLGGVVGWLFAVWSNSTMDWLKPMIPDFMHVELRLDWRAFVFAAAVTGISALLFGLAPALQAARRDVVPGLKSGEWFESKRFRWFSSRNLLVLQQVAGSLMLLLITGFVVLGFERTRSLDLGFDPANLHMASIDPVRNGYSVERAQEMLESLPDRMKRIPGIEEATLTHKVPLGLYSDDTAYTVKTSAYDTSMMLTLRIERVGIGFLDTVGVPMLRGRSFQRADESDDARVLIINETMATKTWPGEDPIGRQVEIEGAQHTVVGMTKDFRSGAVLEPPRPGAFLPMKAKDIARPSHQGVTLLVRAKPGVDAAAAIRNEMRAIDPALTVFNVSSLREEVAALMYVMRLATYVYGGIGLFGLILAVVGLGGVTAYSVTLRTREIGIRMALGAQRVDVLRLVLKEGFLLVVAGTVIGHASAWGAMRALGSFFEALTTVTKTSTSDPLLVIGAPVLLAALTMVACYLPARRATRIDPLVSLRQE
ncbi:MAG: ABC transporter permease [Acidobacteria bacterium]|nr:ABC transporter permease [Acidobacteriota bacterium]